MMINPENGVNKHRTHRAGRKHQESKMRHLQYLSRIAHNSTDDSKLKGCNPGSDPGSKRRDSATNYEDAAIHQRPVKRYKDTVPLSPESPTTLEDVATSQRPVQQCKNQVPVSQESPTKLEDTMISQRRVIQSKDPVPASSRSPTNSEDAAMNQRPLSCWWEPRPVLPCPSMNSEHAAIREQLAKQWTNPVRLYSPRNSEDEEISQLPAWTWCEPGCMSPYPPINPEHAVISQHIVVQDPGPEVPAPPTMVDNSEKRVKKRSRTRRAGRKYQLSKLRRLQYLHGIATDSADDSLPKGCNPASDSGTEIHDASANREDTSISQQLAVQWKDPNPELPVPPMKPENACPFQAFPLPDTLHSPTYPYHEEAGIRHRLVSQHKEPALYSLHSPANPDGVTISEQSVLKETNPVPQLPDPLLNSEGVAMSRRPVMQCMDPIPDSPALPMNSEDAKIYQRPVMQCMGQVPDSPASLTNHEDTALSQQLAMQGKNPNPESPVPPTNPENTVISQRAVLQCKHPIPGSPHSPTYPHHEEAGIIYRLILKHGDAKPSWIVWPPHPDNTAVNQHIVVQDHGPEAPVPPTMVDNSEKRVKKRSRTRRAGRKYQLSKLRRLQYLHGIASDSADDSLPKGCNPASDSGTEIHDASENREDTLISQQLAMQWKDPNPEAPVPPTNSKNAAISQRVVLQCKHPIPGSPHSPTYPYLEEAADPVPYSLHSPANPDDVAMSEQSVLKDTNPVPQLPDPRLNSEGVAMSRRLVMQCMDPISDSPASPTNPEDTAISQQLAMQGKDPNPESPVPPTNLENAAISQRAVLQCKKHPIPRSPHSPTYPYHEEAGISHRLVLQHKDLVPYSLHSPANPDDAAISKQSIFQDTNPVPQLSDPRLNSEGVAMNRRPVMQCMDPIPDSPASLTNSEDAEIYQRPVMQCMDPIPDSPASPTNPEDAGIYQRPMMQCMGQVPELQKSATNPEDEELRRRPPLQWKDPRSDLPESRTNTKVVAVRRRPPLQWKDPHPALPESRTNTKVVAVRRQPAAIRPPPVTDGCERDDNGMFRMGPVNEAICREIQMYYMDKRQGPSVPITTILRPRDDATKRKIKAERDRRKYLFKSAKALANDSRHKGCNPDSDPGSVTQDTSTNHEDAAISQQPALHDDKDLVPSLHELPDPGPESADPPTMLICSKEGVKKRRTHTQTHSAGREYHVSDAKYLQDLDKIAKDPRTTASLKLAIIIQIQALRHSQLRCSTISTARSP